MKVKLALACTVMLVTLGAVLPAHADRRSADSCASKLQKPAKAIYDASAPLLVQGADGRAVVTEQTRKLVMAGAVPHIQAQEMAMAAATCLMQR